MRLNAPMAGLSFNKIFRGDVVFNHCIYSISFELKLVLFCPYLSLVLYRHFV